jgi:transposase-like protein
LKLTGEGGLLARLTKVGSVQIEVPRDRKSSKQTNSVMTDWVMKGMGSWRNRSLDAVYPMIFIDAVSVKIREGNVAKGPIYVALAVTAEGKRDILGLWAGEHGDGEGVRYWMRVLTEIKKRGTRDCLIVVCDGLKGLPEAIATVWPQAIVQTCLVHLVRNSSIESINARIRRAVNAFEITFDGRCPPHGSNTPTRSSSTVNLTDPTGRVPNLIEC